MSFQQTIRPTSAPPAFRVHPESRTIYLLMWATGVVASWGTSVEDAWSRYTSSLKEEHAADEHNELGDLADFVAEEILSLMWSAHVVRVETPNHNALLAALGVASRNH